MKLVLAIALLMGAQEASFAQSDAKHPEFEVASVKRAAPAGTQSSQSPGGPRLTGAGRISISSDRATYQGVTLERLLMSAYDLKAFQISGPAWIETEHYDIAATIPEGVAKEDVPVMLQNLLADRFHVVLHAETKEQPVYILRVGKDGAKLKATSPSTPSDHPRPMAGFGLNKQTGQFEIFQNAETMASFAAVLTNQLSRQVIDQTALAGEFDIVLPVDAEGLPGRSDWPSSLFSAVQSVGLKLEPGKAPVKLLVIEKAEKVPTEN